MPKLIVILGDQLTLDIAALSRSSTAIGDIVLMAEVNAEATYVAHHH